MNEGASSPNKTYEQISPVQCEIRLYPEFCQIRVASADLYWRLPVKILRKNVTRNLSYTSQPLRYV